MNYRNTTTAVKTFMAQKMEIDAVLLMDFLPTPQGGGAKHKSSSLRQSVVSSFLPWVAAIPTWFHFEEPSSTTLTRSLLIKRKRAHALGRLGQVRGR